VTFTAPFELLLEGRPVGTIVSYGYDQPWAMGRFDPLDAEWRQRMVAVCKHNHEVFSWPQSASRAADDARWEAALARRGITDADLALHGEGRWSLRLGDGTLYPIDFPDFDAEGFVTWRW
jgi:hypothetical protein